MSATFQTLIGDDALAAAEQHGELAFHHPAWVRAVAAARGRVHEFVAVRAVTGRGVRHLFGAVHRRGGLPLFESMPYGGYGGWVGASGPGVDDEAALSAQWLRQAPWPVVLLVSRPGYGQVLPEPRRMSWLGRMGRRFQMSAHETHVLDLSGTDEAMISRARPRMRSYLRKMADAGYSCRLEGGETSLHMAQWYRVGSAAWQAPGTSLMPDAFFDNLQRDAVSEVWTAHRDGRCLAAALFLLGRDSVHYQASGSERHHGTISPMDALIWTAARAYRDRGFVNLNLGASDALESVRQFKEKFGARPATYHRCVYVLPRLTRTATVPHAGTAPA
jgi:CelD/BcsL family acetyltransferase involved in cellulose biosynthesis